LNSLLTILIALFLVVGPFAAIFGFVKPAFFHILIIFGIVAVYLVTVQFAKVWFDKKWGYE
jgi:hypothetical protein